jgi:hypothetical protein
VLNLLVFWPPLLFATHIQAWRTSSKQQVQATLSSPRRHHTTCAIAIFRSRHSPLVMQLLCCDTHSLAYGSRYKGVSLRCSHACAAASAGSVLPAATHTTHTHTHSLRPKQAKIPDAQESAVSQKGILAKVLRYVHPTQWPYVVLVSKVWLENFRHNYNPENNTILAKVGFAWSPTERDYVTTLRFLCQLFTKVTAALESVSRLEVAHIAGLDLLCS